VPSARAIATFALLATGLTAALAQQSTDLGQAPAASVPKPLLPPSVINRWVDAHGQVHYGDVLPANAPEQTTEVGPLQSTTPEQKAQAEAQLQQYRIYLEPSSTADLNALVFSPSQGDDCAAQWARYNAAAVCANQYGGLTTAIAQNCPAVPQPQCGQSDAAPVELGMPWPCADMLGKSAWPYDCGYGRYQRKPQPWPHKLSTPRKPHPRPATGNAYLQSSHGPHGQPSRRTAPASRPYDPTSQP